MTKKAIFLFDYTGIMAKPWLDDGYECWCFDGQHPEGVTRDGNHVKVGMWISGPEDAKAVYGLVGPGVSFVFGFPECTQLAVSGAAHFATKREANPSFQLDAMECVYFVKAVGEQYDCVWALENPVSVIATMWRKSDYRFHPWEYGGYLPEDDTHPTYPEYISPRDAYPKKTCIWGGNGFVMPCMKKVGPDGANLNSEGKSIKENYYRATFITLIDGRVVMDSALKYPAYELDGSPIWGYSDQHKKLGGKSLKTKNIRSATPRGFSIAAKQANSPAGLL